MSRCFCYPALRIKVARTTLTPWNDSMLARDYRPRIDGAPFLPCVLAAVILIVPSSAHSQAQWTSNGVPVSVKAGYQDYPQLLFDEVAGVFVAWQDGNPGDIYAQHLNSDGTRVQGWPEGGLGVCTDPGDQGVPYLASDGHGGFFVAWG